MSSFYETVISIISKPSEERKDDEINFILKWFVNLFKNKASVFGEIKSEVISDIIKNCSFEARKRDEIIIKQGDIGDCFYINLRGKVSIYMNQSDNEQENESTSKTTPRNLRFKLGNYITSLGDGESFGEIALVSEDTRSASIIADEITHLMVVNKSLYSRCLHATTLRKLDEKQNFINSSPFFNNWSPKMKKLLSLCLERDIMKHDSYLGKQGEIANRIFFIIR
jgi:signal-transduction protein with cAMP-binding, CBS, and nucleotidyltransferase domain